MNCAILTISIRVLCSTFRKSVFNFWVKNLWSLILGQSLSCLCLMVLTMLIGKIWYECTWSPWNSTCGISSDTVHLFQHRRNESAESKRLEKNTWQINREKLYLIWRWWMHIITLYLLKSSIVFQVMKLLKRFWTYYPSLMKEPIGLRRVGLIIYRRNMVI